MKVREFADGSEIAQVLMVREVELRTTGALPKTMMATAG